MSTVGTAPIAERFCEFFGQFYRDDVATFAQHYPKERQSFWIDASDLFMFDPDMIDDWADNPRQMRSYAESGLGYVDLPADIDLSDATVRLTDPDGYFPRRGVSELSSDDIGRYIGLTGQMAKVTGTNPRLTTAAYECLRCGSISRIPQTRNSLQEAGECSGCQRNGPYNLNVAASEFVDQRKLKLESPPDEGTPGEGQSIVVYTEADLCHHGGENGLPDRAGERVTVFGQLRLDESQLEQRNPSPELDTWFDGQAIEFEKAGYEDINIEQHREEFEELAGREDAVDLCAQSIAPELHRDTGDDLAIVTEAAVAWLFNSYRLDPAGMGQKRGDIHMGIFGDPGLGKSTLLSDLAKLAPKCEFRSGTGLSAVGLTAAAVQEEFAGSTEWTLEPGVLPRANNGHCIIDEVDDVVNEKTKKMHDALEGDQMVKVDKAGISADLPTRTALLISGNPTDGRFDDYSPIAPQIDLDPALVSRMDLLFAMQDEVDKAGDTSKADHILDSYDELSAAELASGTEDAESAVQTIERPVDEDVFRAWIVYARQNVFPTLTEPAKGCLKEFYLETRNLNGDYQNRSGDKNPIPATPRTLESGIRLATAFARANLSETVELEHAERAVRISKHVVGNNYDPENSTFDAGQTDTAQPKSQKDRLDRVVNEIRQHQDEFDDVDGIPHAELADLLGAAGVRTSSLDHDIQKLKDKREIYEPGMGVYRAA